MVYYLSITSKLHIFVWRRGGTVPFDGVVTKCIVRELSDMLPGGRIEKIFQPEADEIILNIRAKGQNLRLLLSASANYPRIHLTNTVKDNPAVPPVFCMFLRKHISGGRIIDVNFMDYERIVVLRIESVNELGDMLEKKLIIEIMGRHSNIILTNNEDKILDSIKHVDSDISRVREVMPARPYVLPPSQDKQSPEGLDVEQFINSAVNSGMNIEKYLLNGIKGFSPLLCREVCFRAGVEGKMPASELGKDALSRLKTALADIIYPAAHDEFYPCILLGEKQGFESEPADFHCLKITHWQNAKYLPSMSQVLDMYYSTKDRIEHLKQKKSDIIKVLNNSIDRCNKKIAIQQDTLRDVADREKLRLFGELITANIYCIPENAKSVSLQNYYSEKGEYVEIPLDENLTAQQNAQNYYRQYAKAKSTYLNTSKQLEESLRELEYLESVLQMLENCTSPQEIDEIRNELAEQGYMSLRKKANTKGKDASTSPLHFKSSDGIDIYVGKNNKQNDYLTLRLASPNDIWLHTKNIPGSHVIIKKSRQDIPERTLMEAAALAAYHSKAKMSSNVPVDYTNVKHVKKPGGAKPGMVIYENYKTINITPDESIIEKLRTGMN